MIFPWQKNEWQQLLRAKQENRLPHALLLSGLKGLGKAHFAEQFARFMLCQNQSETDCNCHACRLVLTKVHPNLLWVEPEKAGAAIKVDQIRAVNDFVHQSSLQGEYRFVLIDPADNMNINAANALLKTLEEPAAGSLLILVNHQLNTLPATILSRCQRLLFTPPPKLEAIAWVNQQVKDETVDTELLLNLSQGAPLSALQLLTDERLMLRKALLQALAKASEEPSHIMQLTSELKESELVQQIDFILSFTIDLMRLQLGNTEEALTNKDFFKELSQLKEKRMVTHTMHFMAYLQQLRGQVQSGFNLNKQLTLENIFIQWTERA